MSFVVDVGEMEKTISKSEIIRQTWQKFFRPYQLLYLARYNCRCTFQATVSTSIKVKNRLAYLHMTVTSSYVSDDTSTAQPLRPTANVGSDNVGVYLDFRTSSARCADEVAHQQQQQQQLQNQNRWTVLSASVSRKAVLPELNTHYSLCCMYLWRVYLCRRSFT